MKRAKGAGTHSVGRIVAAAGLSIVAGLFADRAPGQTPSEYMVQGRIVFSDNHPAARMEISLSVDGQQTSVGPVLSDADGNFHIARVPQGTYWLIAFSQTQGYYLWNQAPPAEGTFTASTVTVGPEHPNAEVAFRIEKRSKVYGVVRDQYGDPVPAVGVYALRRVWAFGRPYFANAWQAGSDDEGAFRLWRLPKGRYRICAVNSAQTEIVPSRGAAAFQGVSPKRVVLADCPTIGPFTDVQPGDERRIDLRLHEVPAMPVQVKMQGGPSQPLQIEFVPKYPLNETRDLFGATMFNANRFQGGMAFSDGVPPGRYWVRATSFQRQFSGKSAITVTSTGPNLFELPVGATPVINLDVIVPPGFDKSGMRVGFHDANDPGAPIVDSNTQLLQGAPTSPTKIALLFPGRYWLVTRGELCASSARAGDVDLLTEALTIQAGGTATVHVRFEKTCGSIRGHVKSRGTAVPVARIAILLSGSPQDPGDVLVATADEFGEYNLTGLASGSYRMWAWARDDEENGRIGSLEEIVSQARVVVLREGESKKDVDLRALQIPNGPAR
jgi:hypothetical protein